MTHRVAGDLLTRALGEENARRVTSLGALPQAKALLATHQELWGLEDAARSTRASDAEVAAIKRGIDRKNAARHRSIDGIDEALGLTPDAPLPAPGDRCHGVGRSYSETLGELLDRLLILALKIDSMARLQVDAGVPAPERHRCASRLGQQLERRSHLQACLSEQLADHVAGRARTVRRAEFKLYNDDKLNPVLRREASALTGDR